MICGLLFPLIYALGGCNIYSGYKLKKHKVRIYFLTISIINPQGPGNYLGTNYFSK